MEFPGPKERAVTYAYGLNMVLAARTDALSNCSKRIDHNFQLLYVQSTFSNASGTPNDDGFQLIMGTLYQDWFANWILPSTIFGDGALPHRIPGEGQFIEKGDSIVVQARNLNASQVLIAMMFHGYFL